MDFCTGILFVTVFLTVIKHLLQELKQLADELRSDVIFNVSKTGGHLGSSLGVVELTVALHYVFNAPQDRLLWDVGHQVIATYLMYLNSQIRKLCGESSA